MTLKSFLRRVYSALPFKQPVFTLLKSVWTVPEPVFRHLHFIGTFRVDVDANASFLIHHHGFLIENELFWLGLSGGWEAQSMQLWLRLCRQARVIFDVGANTGVYALAAKAVNPAATVFAFEMIAKTYTRLVDNVKLNAFDVHCVNGAVSDGNGTAMYVETPGTEDHSYGLGLSAESHAPSEGRQVQVQTVTLESIIDAQRLSALDLLKLDIEGHEPEALAGLGKRLQEYTPTLLIEVLNETQATRLQSIIGTLPYLVFDIDERVGPKQIPHIKPSTKYNLLLCERATAARLGLIAV